MKYLAVLALVLCSCVSTKLAESNLAAVTSLGKVAVETDEVNLPEAQAAVENAEAIVEASAPVAQVLSFGVPTDLVDANTEHVETLTAAVDTSKPEVAAVVAKAERTAANVSGRAHAASRLVDAGAKVPYLDAILDALVAIGSAVGVVYAGTRGRKHVANWWNTPGQSTDQVATQATPGAPGAATPPAATPAA